MGPATGASAYIAWNGTFIPVKDMSSSPNEFFNVEVI